MKHALPPQRYDRPLSLLVQILTAFNAWKSLTDAPPFRAWPGLAAYALLGSGDVVRKLFSLPPQVKELDRLDRRARTGYLIYGVVYAIAAVHALRAAVRIRQTHGAAMKEWRWKRRSRRHRDKTGLLFRLAAALVVAVVSYARASAPHARLLPGQWSRVLATSVKFAGLAGAIAAWAHLFTSRPTPRPRRSLLLAWSLTRALMMVGLAYSGFRNAFLSEEEHARRHARVEGLRTVMKRWQETQEGRDQ